MNPGSPLMTFSIPAVIANVQASFFLASLSRPKKLRQCDMILLRMPAAVPKKRRQWFRHAVLCTGVGVLLSACSALPLTYNHAEGLLLWKIDRYFKLSGEQEKLVRAWLADFHSWHRQTE